MSSHARVNAHRERLRAQGLRPVQLWVPDVRTAQFAADARRQATLVAAAAAQNDDLDFVEAITIDWDE